MIQDFVAQYDKLSKNGGSSAPDWIAPLRRAAIDRFSELGFPTQKNEDWHFTSVQSIADAKLKLVEPAEPAVTAFELANLELGRIAWPTLVFVNGRFSRRLSNLDNLPSGVQAMTLTSVLAGDSSLARPFLAKVAGFTDHSFTALNTAFLGEGAFIHVRAGEQPTVPIRIIYVADRNAAGCVMHPRTLIVADPNSKLSVVESYVGISYDAGGYLTNAVTEVVVSEGATVQHYKLQRESRDAFHVGTVEARQAKDSHFVSFSFATGAKLSRTNIYTLLDGEGCGATLNGLYMTDGDQHVDHQTRIEHAQPNCFSREVYKGILDGSSHGVFNGKVYVHPAAQKTDGKQSNNNLLLSEKAHADTKPQLEIFADDVKCTHGATVGRIDEVALFYMKSRGLGAEAARDLLTYAFAAEVLEQIELEELKLELESLTMSRFTGRAKGGDGGSTATV